LSQKVQSLNECETILWGSESFIEIPMETPCRKLKVSIKRKSFLWNFECFTKIAMINCHKKYEKFSKSEPNFVKQ
jgi:hypothetical protein